MADGSLPIVVTPEAFGRGAFDLAVVEGLTVRGMLVEAIKAGLPLETMDRTEIYVDGVRLPRDEALNHVLKRGQVVNVVVEPLGGGGGRKDIGQILLTVAIIVVSAWIGGPTGPLKAWPLIARVAAATAVQVVGGMAMQSLFGPRGDGTKANDRYALQSASNQYRQWGSMPLALGEVVVAPDLAVKTFTQSQGEDVWLYGVLGLHYGPCEVSELKIGDTLASTMGSGDFRMVQHLTPGPRTFQLYPNDVDQLDLQEELQATPSSETPLVRAASGEGERFDIDFFLPGGLHFRKDDGRILSVTVSVFVRYRPIDATGAATGPWQTGPTMTRTSSSKDPLRITHYISLPFGRYEFELKRSRQADDNDKRRDEIYVTAIKSVAFRKPITDENLSIIEFAVRATAINQGGLAPITCRIKPICQTWTGAGWGAPETTSNPAALARWLLTGPAPAKPMPTAQADVRLRAWSALCDQYDWSCHVYLTETKTQAEALQILERAGRASLFWDGSQVAASPWVEKPAPRQLFTGGNLRDHRWEIVYPEPVHALRVQFQNFDKGGEADVLFVYADGYAEVADPANGIQAATLIEALPLDGQATLNRAYRDGRWALGQRLHQRRVDTWTADVENLISQYGDRVRLAWRRVDGAEARVRCRRWTGGLVSGLRLTQPVEMVAGVDYAVDLRTVNGLFAAVPVQTRPGLSREIIFATPREPDVCPSADDLIAFGIAERVSEDVEIIGIEPGENLSAVLTGVRYVAPLLMAGETGPIPPLQSRLSGDRAANPPRPTLLGVQQDANGVRVSFDLPTWRGSPISGFTVRWRSKAESGEAASWSALPALDGAARELRTPPLREAPVDVAGVEATRVEIEITATTVDGRASRPLVATIVQPAPSRPLSSVWAVAPKAAAADGTSQPILIVTGEVNDPAVAAVLIQWALTAEGPWRDAYQGAPLTKALEISGLTAGVEHYVAITHLSAQGVPSQFLVIGPRVPGALVSDNTNNVGGRPAGQVVQSLDDVLLDVQALEIEAGEIQTSQTQLRAVMQGQGSLLKNPSFWGDWTGQFPNGWEALASAPVKAAGQVSDKAVRYVTAADESAGMGTIAGATGWGEALSAGLSVIEMIVTLQEGSLSGLAAYLEAHRNGVGIVGSWQINPLVDPDVTGQVVGGGAPGRTYTFVKMIDVPAGTDFGRLFGLANWAVAVSRPARTVDFHHVSVRKATAAEVAAGRALGLDPTALSARNAAHDGALADANGKLQAWSQKRVIAGMAQAFAQMMALDDNGEATSSVLFGAKEIGLLNQIGDDEWVKALSLVNGNATVSGNLGAGGRITLGNGTLWEPALKPQAFLRGDGEAIDFGGVNVGIPTYEFKQDNLLPRAAGETYELLLKNLTTAGATVWAKIVTPGATALQSLPGPGVVSGSGPSRQLTKTPKPDAADGRYTVVASGYYGFDVPRFTNWREFNGSVEVEVFVRQAGVWSRVGAMVADWSSFADNPSGSAIQETVALNIVGIFQAGDGVEAIGASLGKVNGPLQGRVVALESISANWTSASAPTGVRSALPPGGKTTIVLTPQG